MKLRNKKTGEIKDIGTIIHEAFKVHEVETLKSIEENWEDAPNIDVGRLPLIEDEKIRKAVRAWADANNLAKVQYYYTESNRIAMFSWYPIYIEIRTDNLGIANRNDSHNKEFYTIEELCGEEEE